MVHLASYRDFQGIFFTKNKDDIKSGPPKPLGGLVKTREQYEFPDSAGFLKLLNEFSKKRNKIFHRLLKVSKEELPGIDADFIALHNMAEEVLNKYNAITTGMTTIWENFVARHRVGQPMEEKDAKVQELQAQIASLLVTITSLQEQLALPAPIVEAPKEKISKLKTKKKSVIKQNEN